MLGLSLLEIISSIAAFQLLMLGLVLLSKKSIKKQSNRILALYMFTNALVLIHFLFYLLDLFYTPDVPIFYYLLAPILYLYVRSMCDKDFALKPVHLAHGLIFALASVYVAAKDLFVAGPGGNWPYYEFLYAQVILHVQIALYILASLLSIYNYRKEIKDHFSSVERIDLSWLLLILIGFAAMWGSDLVAFILIVVFGDPGSISYYLVVSSVTINLAFANYLVYKGLQQADTLNGLKTSGKYSGSKIPEEARTTMVRKLKEFMDHKKPYLNPDLSIKDLSEPLNIHPKFLSQLINSQFDQNFYDFVNFYRIEEAKKILHLNEDKKMTILEVLYEVGFNSKSAFNTAFKKYTGKTPTEFRRTG